MLVEARKVAGSATYKQSETVKIVVPFNVHCLFIQFFSIMEPKKVCLFSLVGQKKLYLFLLIKIYPPTYIVHMYG